MIWLLVMVVAIQVLGAWIWFWPPRWWRWIERTPAGFYDPFAFFRSLPVLLLSLWIAVALGFLETRVFGDHPRAALTLPLLVIPFLPGLILWGGVVMVGWPRFLVPPGARRDVDRADARSVVEHPLMWLAIIAAIFGVVALGVWVRSGSHH
jgi:hypothetical protein